jgi:hypothetical protein
MADGIVMIDRFPVILAWLAADRDALLDRAAVNGT